MGGTYKVNALTVWAVINSLLLFPASFMTVLAADQGSGVVTLEGQIIESACSLDAGSAYQVIEMDPTPVGRLVREGEGEPHPFSLRLVSCTLAGTASDQSSEPIENWQHVRVTFEGVPDRGGRSFAAFGTSQGVALHITDAEGQESIPGVPMPLKPVTGANQVLHYTLRLVGNDRPISVGTHRASVRFRLEYY